MRSMRNTKWKLFSRALALGASTLLVTVPASAQGINVFVDGRIVNFAGVPPTTQDGRLLVPLRGVFEALGAVVDYDGPTRTIEALRGQTRLRLTLGSNMAFVNGQPVRLDVPATTSLGRTLVPLRFVGEALGAQVNWNASDRSVVIVSPEAPSPSPIFVPSPSPTPLPPQPMPDPVIEEPLAQTTVGTVVAVDAMQNGRITIRRNNIDQTYTLVRNASIERRPLLNRSTPENPEFGSTVFATLGDIRPGEVVELTFNNSNRVTRVTAMPSVSVARIRSATGNRIILDDGREIPYVIGGNLRYLDQQGRETTTANLRAGDEVVLFVSPENRRVYQISAARSDLNAAYGREVRDDYLPPIDQTPVPGDRPQIELITFTTNNANGAVAKAGDTVTVNVRGTAGLQGSFDISPRATDLPLRERPNRPGTYFATYTVRQGDDVTNGRVTVRLVGRNGEDTTQQSLDTFSIDTEAPIIISTRPQNGTVVDNRRPNIIVYADELGSGLAPSTITISNNGQTFEVPTTSAQRMSVSAVPQRDLSGRVDVRADIRDEAGNVATSNFFFTVRGGNNNDGRGAIQSIYHNGNRVLQPGERLTVDMVAESGGRASFDLLDQNGNIIARDIAMTEIQRDRGLYRGEYTIQGVRDTGQLRIIGRFRDMNGNTTTSEATTGVDIIGGDNNLNAPVITFPTEGETVDNQITIRGRGVAGSVVNVSVRAQGTQYYVLPYNVELTTPTVRVRNNGIWETAPITLPRPRSVSGLSFVITATQTDTAGRESQAATVTVRPQ